MAIPPGRIGVVPVNCVVAVPDNHFLMLAIRSSTPIKRGLILANGIGVVDPFFCGNSDEIVVQLLNVGETVAHIQRGESLVQAILMRSEDFNWTEVASMNQVRDENIGYDLEEVHGTVVTLNQRGNTDKESL